MASQKRLVSEIAREISEVQRLEADTERLALQTELSAARQQYKAALREIERERKRADSIASMQGIVGKKYKPRAGRKRHQATMMLLCSDWHCEERVDPATVNGLNDFSLEVADRRISELVGRFLCMVEHERRLVDIRRLVVWLGGDFISGHIHPDTAELASLSPLAAIRWAGERIRGLLDALAEVADEVVVATSCGNHGRSNADKPRVGTELEHNFEQHLYLTLAQSESKKNVRWQVGEGHLNYLDLNGFLVRFHHGHSLKYQGGVGGIHVGVAKANAAWNSTRPADLTCFGHWHQFSWLRAGKYVSNGSLIGHSAYTTARVKAAYEPPCQAAIVLDHERNEVTKAYPIFCDKDLALRIA